MAGLAPQGSLARAAAVLVSGTALGQALVVLSSPLLTRIYSPSDFGRFGLFVSFVNTATVVTGLRYEGAIIAAPDDAQASSLLLLTILICLPVSAGLAAILFGLIHFNVLSYGLLPVSSALTAAIFSLVIGISTAMRYWLLRMRAFRVLGEVSALQGLMRAIVPFVGAAISVGWLGLVLGDFMGRLAGFARMSKQSAEAIRVGATQGLGRARDVASKYWKFPAISVPSSFVEALSASTPLILIAHLYGETAAGIFFLVFRVVSLPTSLVATSIADVYHTRVAEHFRTGADKVRSFLLATAKHLAVLASVLVIPAALILWLGFGTIFGKRWGEGAGLVLALAPWTIASLVVGPLSRVLLVTQQLEQKLWYDVFTLLSTAAALYGGRYLALSLTASVALLSAVRLIGYALYFWVLLRAVSSVAILNAMPDAQ